MWNIYIYINMCVCVMMSSVFYLPFPDCFVSGNKCQTQELQSPLVLHHLSGEGCSILCELPCSSASSPSSSSSFSSTSSTASVGWQRYPPDLNRKCRMAVFPAGPQLRGSCGSVPRRTSLGVPRQTSTASFGWQCSPHRTLAASQKICQIERQIECQKICQIADMSETLSEDMAERCQKECQQMSQKECQKDCQKTCQKDLRVSEDMQETVSERMSKDMPERMSDRVSEEMPERILEDMPDIINVRHVRRYAKNNVRRYARKDIRNNVRRYARKNAEIMVQYIPNNLSD